MTKHKWNIKQNSENSNDENIKYDGQYKTTKIWILIYEYLSTCAHG